jgi:hypothetical protein
MTKSAKSAKRQKRNRNPAAIEGCSSEAPAPAVAEPKRPLKLTRKEKTILSVVKAGVLEEIISNYGMVGNAVLVNLLWIKHLEKNPGTADEIFHNVFKKEVRHPQIHFLNRHELILYRLAKSFQQSEEQ